MQSLSTAHEALLQQSWAAAKIRDIVTGVLGAVESIDRFRIDRPGLEIGARATLSLSLLLHELFTNALEYGSLSQPGGTVEVSWRVAGDDLKLRWRETGGPDVHAPTGKGFGSRLISIGLIGTGGSLTARCVGVSIHGRRDLLLARDALTVHGAEQFNAFFVHGLGELRIDAKIHFDEIAVSGE